MRCYGNPGKKVFQMDRASLGFDLMEVSEKSCRYWRKLKYEYNMGKLKSSCGQHCWSFTVKGNGAVTEGDQRSFWVWVGNGRKEGSTFVFQVEIQVPDMFPRLVNGDNPAGREKSLQSMGHCILAAWSTGMKTYLLCPSPSVPLVGIKVTFLLGKNMWGWG